MEHDVTGLLLAWGQGDEQALHRLMPLVLNEWRAWSMCSMIFSHVTFGRSPFIIAS